MSDGWDRAARGFARVSEGYFADATAPFFRFARLRRGARVLDVACGPGTSTRLAARRGALSLGVDLSPAMIALARRKGPRSAFRVMDAESLGFPDASFDAVLCHLGLMLFSRPRRAAREMVRALKPGGTLACLTLGSNRRMKFTNLLCEALPPPVPDLERFAARGALARELSAAGLRRVESRRLSGTFRVASPEAYWRLALESFGKLGPLVLRLPAARREAVRRRLFAKLASYKRKDGTLAIPYEFVMARGRKP